MRYFVEVLLPIPLSKSFTYSVTKEEFLFVEVGFRVAVPFGKSKVYTALVIDKHQVLPNLYEPKPIIQIIDETAVVNSLQLEHWKWIANYYLCTLGEVYKTALPVGLMIEGETLLSLNSLVDLKLLTDEEYLIVEALQKFSAVSFKEVIAIAGKKNIFPLVNSLVAKNAIVIHETIIEKYTPKIIKYIVLAAEYQSENGLQLLLEIVKNARKQKEIIIAYYQLLTLNKPILKKDLLEKANATSTTLNALIEKQIFIVEELKEDRVVFESKNNNFQLNTLQSNALQEIESSFESKNVVLLHGVTASGKTEVYIKLIEKYIQANKQVLYLLPEIALTTQLVERLTAYFGNQIAVYHSNYNANERVEVWNALLRQSETAKIIIGVRSALFLPFSKLGLIVIDEEHEATFKQNDPAPRYHARDAAIVLANSHSAKVLLGSATPSLESYLNAQSNKYGLVSLTKRYGDVVLPTIELVDLKESYFRKKMQGHFSNQLIEAIQEELDKKKQIILFQNRRGFSPFLECVSCGNVPHCHNCNVSLTYYKNKNQLRCHYCSYTIANQVRCVSCGSLEMTSKGFGTEQIEEEVKAFFPNVSVARMDHDTTKGKNGYQKIIDAFKNQEVSILVGTQMLAKGLHFSNVSLVGVLNADNLLNQPHFRAHEKAFQMLTQVAGRSGRMKETGKVIIQTYATNHDIIKQVVTADYEGMSAAQLYERKIYKYPPYTKLIRITFKNKDFEKVGNAALWFANVLKQNSNAIILGPEEPAINRVRNEYIQLIMVKIPEKVHLTNTKEIIKKALLSFEAIAAFRSVRVSINVDYN